MSGHNWKSKIRFYVVDFMAVCPTISTEQMDSIAWLCMSSVNVGPITWSVTGFVGNYKDSDSLNFWNLSASIVMAIRTQIIDICGDIGHINDHQLDS